jgi:hypothetical protein
MNVARLVALATSVALLLLAGGCRTTAHRVEYKSPVVVLAEADFHGTVWKSRDARDEDFRFFKLRSDGQFGWNHHSPNNFHFDGDDMWSLEGGMLILNHDNGAAVEKYPMPDGMMFVLRGRKASKRHENSSLVVLTRVK